MDMLNVNLLWQRASDVPVRPTLMRGARELGSAFASRTFMFIVLAPFVAWACLLMWVHAQFPDEVVRAVADGPCMALLLWGVAVILWFMLSFTFGRYRHSLAVGLGYLAIQAVMALQPPTARDASRAHLRAAPSMQHPGQVVR
jgi:hypothetical protein